MQQGSSLDAVDRATASYYGAKVQRHGATPEGADWRCQATQQMRFVQLLRVCGDAGGSLNDLGCGWGGLLHFLGQRRRLHRFDYLGVDLSAEMIAAARRARPRHAKRFVQGSSLTRMADYSVASGVFNVRLQTPLALWERFVERTLHDLAAHSRRGFAVNFMQPVEPGVVSPPQLYRPDPQRWRSFVEEKIGWRVEVLGGYGLREATLLARP